LNVDQNELGALKGRETDDGVAFTISVYGDTGSRRDGGVRIRSLFSWAPGARPAGTPSYANGTLFSAGEGQ